MKLTSPVNISFDEFLNRVTQSRSTPPLVNPSIAA